MAVVVITPPEPLVSLDLAKAHLRVDGDDHDALIERYIKAASRTIDGPEGWLGRAIGPQTLEDRRINFWPESYGVGRLTYGPIIDIVSVKYLDALGAEQTVATDAYLLSDSSTLQPAYSLSWPSPRYVADAVKIRYRAGYVADPTADPLQAAIPDDIVTAVLLHLNILYDQPEEQERQALERARDAFLDPYRNRRV